MANTDEFTLQFNAPQTLRIAYWGALGLGVVLFLVGLFGNSGNGIGWIAAACFLGILSRVG